MIRYHLRSERGIAALIALIMVGMLTLIGLAALSTSEDEVAITGNQLQETRAFYAAEAGMEIACAAIQEEYEATNKPPTTMPEGSEEINMGEVTYTTVDNGPAVAKAMSLGVMGGLNALVKSFDVSSTGTCDVDSAQVVLSQTFETAFVPLMQYAVFYDGDLEISGNMTLIGRVHTNADMYLQSTTTLKMDSYVSAAGRIQHGKKGPGVVTTGDVQVKNAKGVYKSMKQGSNWLDNNSTFWYDSSVARWNGRVRDEEHGQNIFEIPLVGTTDAHTMIEPASGNPNSYESQAELKIINNIAYKKTGTTWTDITADLTALGIITYTADKFYDQREGQLVDVTDLDLAKLYLNLYAPANGIIYFSDNISGGSEWPALRLRNGSELGGSLTVASANPVYTLGHFNTVGKKPVAILCDALTFLSGAWDDTKGALLKSFRTATNTTVNVSYVTGNTTTTSTIYNGGFENLPRLLESWTGRTLTWRGSAACLWNSKQATANWSTVYFDPPNRAWTFDTDLDDWVSLPPGSPTMRVFQRTGWKQEYVGYVTDTLE